MKLPCNLLKRKRLKNRQNILILGIENKNGFNAKV